MSAADNGGTDDPGSLAYTATVSASSFSSNGLVYLTLWDSFDDAGVDHIYGQGSTVTVSYEIIPTPASLAVLGLGGLAATRRRR